MKPHHPSFIRSQIMLLILGFVIFVGNSFATGPVEKVVYSFQGPPDGILPQAGLVADAAGNLYGTTINGGASNCGTVFELSPPSTPGGPWTEKILYSFPLKVIGSANPAGTLIFDKHGNIFGTGYGGGVGNNYGSVFELSPPSVAGGDWIETDIWIFNNGVKNDGEYPLDKLVMDANGNLYGNTPSGGAHGDGMVFELIPPSTSDAQWRERILYHFGAVTNDGVAPIGDLFLRDGVLYGTTVLGGKLDGGTVFQLVGKPGLWTQTILYNFALGDDPVGGLVADGTGNFYGTTRGGGNSTNCPVGCGTIYELSPPAAAGDPWQENTLYVFNKNGDGALPLGTLWRDKLGDLYGTANQGGINGSNLGTVFKLKPPAISGAAWTFVALHSFRGATFGDGANPYGALILVNGAFYGTTDNGGERYTETRTGGAVYSIVP
jgi:uncharacterized repeat protein (TIGR03803 family)